MSKLIGFNGILSGFNIVPNNMAINVCSVNDVNIIVIDNNYITEKRDISLDIEPNNRVEDRVDKIYAKFNKEQLSVEYIVSQDIIDSNLYCLIAEITIKPEVQTLLSENISIKNKISTIKELMDRITELELHGGGGGPDLTTITINDNISTPVVDNTDSVANIVSHLARVVKSITGKASWDLAADKSLTDKADIVYVDTELAKKSDNGHDHNDIYNTKEEINTLLADKVNVVAGAGLITDAEKNKLAGIASGAEVNQNAFSSIKVGATMVTADNKTDILELVAGNGITLIPDTTNDKITITGVNQYEHPATHPASIIVEETDKRFMTDAERTKLSGTSTGANKVESSITNGNIKIDGVEKTVYTHPTGTNPHGTTKADIDLGNVENKSSETIRSEITSNNVTSALGYMPLNPASKGTANGLAELDSGGKVPSYQLPSYVDDVLEYSSLSSFPATGETGKIYVAIDTNLTYRWSGTGYVEISPSIALGETSSTAYRGDRGKVAYDHSQLAHDKNLVDLGNVDNTSDLNKPISTATQAAIDLKVDKVTGKQLSTEDYTTTEKSKLAGIASGAEVNQNTFSNVKVGTTTIAADNKTDTLELVAGTGITLTPDATNDKITITGVNQYEHPATHPASIIVEETNKKFMTDAERTKLSGTSTGANKVESSITNGNIKIDGVEKTVYTHPTGTNPHGTTKADVGLGNVDNTSDVNKNVLSATKLTTARTINGVSFDGTTNITITDSTKEPAITSGIVSQFWSGTKTWRNLATDVRAVVLTGLSTATNAVITATDTILSALGKLQKQISDNLTTLTNHTGNTNNPHSVTKAQVGLSNVTDYEQVKRIEMGVANGVATLDSNGKNAQEPKTHAHNYLPLSGGTVNGNLYANRYLQNATGVPTSNLGNPTITEMALFDSQFNNKAWFYPPDMFTFEYTDDGVNWITQSISESQVKNFVSGYINTSIYIPNGCKQYRIRIDNKNSYVYINALYMYFSTSGNNTKVKISKKRDDGDWVQHTDSEQTVSSWPGHLYLPFNTIPWSRATTSGHYRYIEILFIPNWNHATNNITLYSLELWGGYPTGSRSLFSWDGDKNATFPAELKATTFKNKNGTEVSYNDHLHTKSNITDMPTKLSQFTNDSNFIISAQAPVQSVAGKTGAVILNKSDVSLGNVDNTSDVNKPISTATQAALNLKAPLASPILTGTPTAPTAEAGTNTTQIATTEFVQAAMADMGGVSKLLSFEYVTTATVENQTKFNIPHETFDKNFDTLVVFKNRTKLESTQYTITNPTLDELGNVTALGYITITGGVNLPTTINFIILKNTLAASEESIDGKILAVGTTPMNRVVGLEALGNKMLTVQEGANKVESSTTNGNIKIDGAEKTVYTHPSTHPYSMLTGTPTSLPANGGNADTVDGYHASSFLLKSGGSMSGILTAQNNTSYTTKQMRNIILSTADPSGGSNGDIWIKYKP